MKEQTRINNGIGFVGMLLVLFIGLKLSNIINWAWLWVLSPVWVAALVIVLVLAGYTLFFVIKYPGIPLLPQNFCNNNHQEKKRSYPQPVDVSCRLTVTREALNAFSEPKKHQSLGQ